MKPHAHTIAHFFIAPILIAAAGLNYIFLYFSSNNGSGADPQIPDPDYSPILIRKISKKKKEHRRKTNLEIWGNAARYKGICLCFSNFLFTFL